MPYDIPYTLFGMSAIIGGTMLLFATYDEYAGSGLEPDFSFTSNETSEVLLWDGSNTDWAFVVHEHQGNLWFESRK